MPKIALLLTPDFADWEYALLAGTGGPYFGLEVEFFAPQAGAVKSMGGLSASVSHTIDEITAWQPDALVVVGGLIWNTSDAPDISGLIRAHHKGGGVVAGICAATLALAQAGLLNGNDHTSNELAFLVDNVEGYSGSGHYRQGPAAVSHNRVITAPGTAPVSFTAAVFESIGVDAEAVRQFRQMMAAEHG